MLHRRNEFSSATKREAYARSDGICECHRVRQLPTYGTGCGCSLGEGNTFYEHIDQDALGGRNDIDNCAVLVRTCWRLKTDSVDLPMVARNNRQRDRSRGIRPAVYSPLPGTRASGIRKPMRPFAAPVDRRTGQPFKGWR
jgi:hypothetical protein